MAEREIAIVTGAANGIGRATTERFARDPKYSPIYAVDRDPSVNTIFKPSSNIVPLQVDLRSTQQIDAMMDRIIAESGGVGLVVNAAGTIIAGREKRIYEHYRTEDGRKKYLSMQLVNNAAVFQIMRRAGEVMRKNGKGTIVNITSSKEYFPDPFRMEYMKSKQDIERDSLQEAKLLKKDNIRVVVVKPGNTRTNIDKGVWTEGSDAMEMKTVQSFFDWWRNTFGSDPESVAEVIYGIAEEKIKGTKIHVGFDAKLGQFLVRTVP